MTGSSISKKAERVPTEIPPFTIGDLRAAIPKHCFERSNAISILYVVVDLSLVLALGFAIYHANAYITREVFGTAAPLLRHVLWTVYWIAQGAVMTGLWVIGHECGHGGFSSSGFISDTFGLAIHSALLVPYFSWKYTHARHHANTGNLDRDEVFVPSVSSTPRGKDDDDDDMKPPVLSLLGAVTRLLRITFMLTMGWPLYLIFNATGHPMKPGSGWANHFTPWSPLFRGSERPFVLLSDLTLVAVGYALFSWSRAVGLSWVIYLYGIPYLITNFWLVFITFLQHTDNSLPHYTGAEWDWLRGALATVDRDYGLILNLAFHHIADTHVCHHLFSSIPHYHAQEATEALKKVLGKYYRFDNTPIFKAMWNNYPLRTVAPDRKNPGVMWLVY